MIYFVIELKCYFSMIKDLGHLYIVFRKMIITYIIPKVSSVPFGMECVPNPLRVLILISYALVAAIGIRFLNVRMPYLFYNSCIVVAEKKPLGMIVGYKDNIKVYF